MLDKDLKPLLDIPHADKGYLEDCCNHRLQRRESGMISVFSSAVGKGLA